MSCEEVGLVGALKSPTSHLFQRLWFSSFKAIINEFQVISYLRC